MTSRPDTFWDDHESAAQMNKLMQRDPQGFSFAFIMERIEGIANSSGWDEPPAMIAIQRQMLTPEMLAELAEHDDEGDVMYDGGVLASTALPLPDDLESGDDLFEFMVMITARIVASDVKLPQGIMGFILLHEGYISMQMRNPEMEFLRPSEDPNRLEVRFTLGVDNAGVAYQFMRRRDTDQCTLMLDGQPAGLRLSGQLTDGLRLMASAATAEPVIPDA